MRVSAAASESNGQSTKAGVGQPSAQTLVLSRRMAIQWALCSVGVFVIVAAAIATVGWRGDLTTATTITVRSPASLLPQAVWAVTLLVGVTVVHELVHAGLMRRYGARPTVGVGRVYGVIPYCYADPGPEAVFSRNQAVVVLLAPVVTLTLAGALVVAAVPSTVVVVVVAANAAGSVGDLWLATRLASVSSRAHVVPFQGAATAGFRVFDEAGSRFWSRGVAAGCRFAYGLVATVSVLSVIAVGAVLTTAGVGSGAVTLGDPDGPLYFGQHAFDPETGTATVEVGFRTVGVAALAGGVVATVAPSVGRCVGLVE